MTCTVVFEVCQQSQCTDKESCAKVEQQRTRALFKPTRLSGAFQAGLECPQGLKRASGQSRAQSTYTWSEQW